MPFRTDIAVALRDWGLPVVEVNGWKKRGSSSFNPGGSVNHHTAGSTQGSLPSYNVLVNGHGSLPGPLCNVAQSRSSNFNASAKFDDVYVIAAGRANHAGEGGWKGMVGNSSVFGLEIEHCGNLSMEPWPERRQHTAYRVHAAFAELTGRSVDYACQHKEWAPTRKIDFIGSDGDAFRTATALTILGRYSPTPTTPEEEAMLEEIKNFFVIYLKKNSNPAMWDTDTLKSYNHHLWLLLTGQKTLEELRQAFQGYAGL